MDKTKDIAEETFAQKFDAYFETLSNQGPEKETPDEYLLRISPQERLCVELCHFKYHVWNGGFQQWIDNGYSQQGMNLQNIQRVFGDPPFHLTPCLESIQFHMIQAMGLGCRMEDIAKSWKVDSQEEDYIYDRLESLDKTLTVQEDVIFKLFEWMFSQVLELSQEKTS